MALLLQDI